MNFHVHVLLWFSESDGIDARSPDEVTHQRDGGGRRRADDVDATVSVVIVISHLGADQDVSRFTAGTVRGHYPIPVIVESWRPRNAGRRTWAGVIGGEPGSWVRTAVQEQGASLT
jgi:hypothetical protein